MGGPGPPYMGRPGIWGALGPPYGGPWPPPGAWFWARGTPGPGNFRIFQKICFLAYLITPGVPGPLESNAASKNTPGELSTASDRELFIDFR